MKILIYRVFKKKLKLTYQTKKKKKKKKERKEKRLKYYSIFWFCTLYISMQFYVLLLEFEVYKFMADSLPLSLSLYIYIYVCVLIRREDSKTSFDSPWPSYIIVYYI